MVDNWFMENVIADINDNLIPKSRPYADLLSAIMLWDNVYYPANHHNWWLTYPSQIKDALQPIEDINEQYRDEAVKLYCHFLGKPGDTSPVDADDIYWYKQQMFPTTTAIGEGAFRYMLLSNKYDCDYLPCEERQIFLRGFYSRERLMAGLTRMKFQSNFDKTIEDYYKETYRALDFSQLKFEMPVLANYIIDNTPPNMSPFDFALHLKHERALIEFRQYLELVENALEHQNWSSLRYLLKNSEDVINGVIAIDKKKIASIDMTVFPMPSISLSTDVFIPKRKIHLTFLKDLTNYAINDMKPLSTTFF